jgi:peptidoglycan hydrolase CwlO-like protein
MNNGDNGTVVLSKKTLIPIGLVFVLMSVAVAYATTQVRTDSRLAYFDEKIEALSGQIEALDVKISEIKDCLGDMKVDIAVLKKEVEDRT